MKRPDGGGSFTPFWFFSPSFNTTTFMIFLLKMLELISKVGCCLERAPVHACESRGG